MPTAVLPWAELEFHMKKRMIASLLAGLSLLALCACDPLPPEGAEWKPWPQKLSVKSDTLCVQKVENLPEDFIFGMDASCVPALEAGGVRYYDHAGTQKDVFEILRKNGLNYIRVRVWNDPYDAAGNGYGGGNCDLDNAIEIGKRATKYEMRLLVDFHYSDFWADPGKQMPPKAWQDFDIEQKSEALYNYTKESLQALKNAGVHVGMVQIGNETNGFFCGERDWEAICTLLSAGSKAVREVMPYALVAVHFTNPEKAGTYADYAQKLSAYGVDYDVFASSYYPYWHGSLENLAAVLSHVATTYHKKVMVAETSYAFTTTDTDFHGNTVGAGGGVSGYPLSRQGQADFLRDLTDTLVNNTQNAIGLCYWEGTWISAGGKTWQENSKLWEKYGSGWASSYAASYDPKDAGNYYGGNAVDNQAFFTQDGKATEVLKVFALMQRGNPIS